MECISITTSATFDISEGFSPTLRQSAPSVISIVAGDAASLHSLSFNSLRAATFALLDVNHDTFDNISQLKDEISSKPYLVYFVKEYLKSIIDTLRFFTAVKDSLQKAREAEVLVRDAVVLFEDGHGPPAALEKLRKFKEEGNPFTEKFIEEFKLMGERQKSIVRDLLLRRQELNRKLRSFKAWRKVWNIVYFAAFAAVLICVVVLAAVAAPSAATAMAAATAAMAAASGVMVPLRQWVDSLWDLFQSPYEGEKDVINSLKEGTKLAVHELNSIRVLVEELEIKIRSTIHNVEFAIEEEEEAALKIVMLEIKLKAGTFAKCVEDLEKEVDRRGAELKTAIAAILETVTD
ncbi:hypothetical protein J5N97_015294 [Dioscorea zingiberensis]|uniref:Uncharacterized protein n=1 Tax=Dioscorea zingiberensis TaxID=325984 RepID=A0A9D5CTZ0_9LILI|nr:hypothetical protein J5N97_015294 [Dioscorea zingiberensis]